LVRLLSELEFIRVQVEEKAAEKKTASALEISLAMVDRVATFAERHVAGEAAAILPTLLARAGDLYSSARPVLGEQSGSSIKSLLGWFTKSADDQAERRRILRSTIGGVKEVLDSTFSLFETGFRSPAQSRQWAQTYSVFLADLAKVLDKLEC
jgi:hypothetical protein